MSEPCGIAVHTAPFRGGVGVGVGAVELPDHRLEGERHVGAGVAVGHGVDVEAVQLVLVGAECVAIGGDDATQVGGTERLEDAHGWDGTAADW